MQWIYLAPQRVLACLRNGVAAAVQEAQEVDVEVEVEVEGERLSCLLVRLTLLMTPSQTESWVQGLCLKRQTCDRSSCRDDNVHIHESHNGNDVYTVKITNNDTESSVLKTCQLFDNWLERDLTFFLKKKIKSVHFRLYLLL